MAHIDASHGAIEARDKNPLEFDRSTVGGERLFRKNQSLRAHHLATNHAIIEARDNKRRKFTQFTVWDIGFSHRLIIPLKIS